jgi:hypothetical protein
MLCQIFTPTRKSVPCLPECTGPLNKVSQLMLKFGKKQNQKRERHHWLLTHLSAVTWISSSSSVICKTTDPKLLPKRFLHIVRSRAFSFNWQYHLLSLRSSSSFLRLLPRLLVTYICPFIFPSITCFRKQFLRKMWPIQLASRFLISCRIFLCSLTLRRVFILSKYLLCLIRSKISAYSGDSVMSVCVVMRYMLDLCG